MDSAMSSRDMKESLLWREKSKWSLWIGQNHSVTVCILSSIRNTYMVLMHQVPALVFP